MASNYEVTKDEILAISGVNPLKCMQCGKCSGTCPAYDEMEYHPNQFVLMVERGEIDKLMASKSIYKCMSCMACIERCPRQVEPAKLVEAIRTVANGGRAVSEEVERLMKEDPPVKALTPRQMEILEGLMRGLTNQDIATQLGIREDRVKEHVKALLSRLGAANRTEAATIAMRKHLLKF